MLTIYSKNNTNNSALAQMFFELNDQEFELTSNANRNDINIVLFDPDESHGKFPAQTKIISGLAIFDDRDDHVKQLVNNLHGRPDNFYYVTNCIDHTVSHPNLLHVDFLFNRTKAYYSQFPFMPGTFKWYYAGIGRYVVPEPRRGIDKSKIFLAPNKTHKKTRGRTLTYRVKLVEFLIENFKHLGFVGNADDTPELVLYSQSAAPELAVLPPGFTTTDPVDYRIGLYNPPHVHYYNESFISIYGETIETGTSILATEKTYDPLIKGHFILPFSSSGLISHLKTLGFKFPAFIDYSYDNVLDDNQRFKAYVDEISRLLNLNSDVWPTEYFNNRGLIDHNRKLFWKRSYDQIDFESIIEQHR